MTTTLRDGLKQRADYTHRHNARAGRHGWLRLTPAYSLKIVNEILASSDAASASTVLDPFSGTATTALAASYLGHRAIAVELNPFLHWFGLTKTNVYDPQTIASVADLGSAVTTVAQRANARRSAPPPMHGIHRWWDDQPLDLLCRIHAAIDEICPEAGQHRDLLLVAFCRLLIDVSNVRFNHQSLSLGSQRHSQLTMQFAPSSEEQYSAQLHAVIESAADNPHGDVQLIQGDARDLAQMNISDVDLLITSPPYVNRMSYIRELRPHMYWLGHLNSGREAGELDWQAIGGTWGVATSRLAAWKMPTDAYQPAALCDSVEQIASEQNQNGLLLANYVRKYFADVWTHLRSARETLNAGAQVHYIIGNSSFYGVLVPAERIYAEMLAELGFEQVGCEPIRKRNSNKKLFEFDVKATLG